MDYQFVLDAAKKRRRVLEDYEFNENVRIGRGSYGQVYKAVEKPSTCFRKYYALKEIELTSYSPSTCREIAVSLDYISLSEYLFSKKIDFSAVS